MAKRKTVAKKVVMMPEVVVTSARMGGSSNPTHSEIAARAYELFCERGGSHGQDLNDWLQAEQELRQLTAAVA